MAAALLGGCGGGGTPVDASLARLAAHQESYSDRQVSVQGMVKRLRNPDGARYYALSDRRGDLVALQPGRVAARHVGQQVAVTGTFVIDPHVGRLIRIQGVRVLRTR